MAVQAAAFAFPPLAQYNEIVERTLFDATRRAAAEEADEAPAAAAADLREYVLTGVVVTPEAKIAFLRDKQAAVLRVEPGGTLGKWLVAEIRENGVTLRRGTATRELQLYDADDLPAAKIPPTVAAPAPATVPAATADAPPPITATTPAPTPKTVPSQPGAAPKPMTRAERRALARRNVGGGNAGN
jgi:hypothetical protein